MPSLAQFDTAEIFADPGVAGGHRMIHVGGPLEFDPESDLPLTVNFLIVQNLNEHDHDPTHGTRVRGSTTDVRDSAEEPGKGKAHWDAVVPAGNLQVAEEARGIGIAVLEKKNRFSYETLIWCDHIDKIEETSVEAVANGLGATSLAEATPRT